MNFIKIFSNYCLTFERIGPTTDTLLTLNIYDENKSNLILKNDGYGRECTSEKLLFFRRLLR